MAGTLEMGQPVGDGQHEAGRHTQAQGDKLLTVAERNLRRFLETAVFRDEADRQAALNCLEVLTTPAPAQPIDMVLHCPKCGLQHIDAPDDRTPDWKNEPHRSHLCHNPACGYIWRPADVPTNGVQAVKTKGKADSPIAATAPAQPGQEGERDYPPLPNFDSGDEPIWDAIFCWKTAQPGGDAHRKSLAVERAIAETLRAYVDADRAARAAPQPATADAVDAARWNMLPAFFEEYQIDAMKLYRDIDAALAAQREVKP